MKKIVTNTAVLFSLVLIAASSLSAQTPGTTKAAATNGAAAASPQTVNAQQAGPWTVGIDPAKNAVKLLSSDAEPVSVRVVSNGTGRKPFQARAVANFDLNSTLASAVLPIPAGKRLVIENISAIARSAPGTRMQIQFFTYLDNGDGIDNNDIMFHRVALTDQGNFVGYATSSANHKVLIFADEQIGSNHYGITLELRLDAPATGGLNQGQVTFSGYMEDLPTP